MNEVKISIEPRKLNEDDILSLEAFVASPLFGILKKLIDNQRSAEMSNLMALESRDEILRCQGRIRGLTCIETLPRIIAEMAPKIREKRKPSKKSDQ